MVDPISIISLAAATTKAAYSVSTQLYLFTNSVKNLDETINGLANEFGGLRRSLDATCVALQNPLVRTVHALDEDNTPIWAAVAGALDDARQTLESFERQITPHQKDSSRRSIFKRSLATWKLNLSKADLNGIRDQIHSHTGSLQIALQTLNILVSGLGPAKAAQDIGQSISGLTEALNQSLLAHSKQDVTGTLRQGFVEKAARSVLANAPDLVSSGSLHSGNESLLKAASVTLNSAIKDFDQSLRRGASTTSAPPSYKAAGPVDNDESAGSPSASDSDEDIHASLVEDLESRADTAIKAAKYPEAEAYLRDAFAHAANTDDPGLKFDADAARFDLAICCLYQDKVQEAELILLLLVKDTDTVDNRSLRAQHALAVVYACLFDFEMALSHCTAALKGRKRLFGKQSQKHRSSLQLMSLLYHVNGDFVSAAAYRSKLAFHPEKFDENQYALAVFIGYVASQPLRQSLQEKKQALNELAAAGHLEAQRHIMSHEASHELLPTRIVFHPHAEALRGVGDVDELMWAVFQNKPLVVKYVLSRGQDPNGGFDNNPLISAAYKAFAGVVRVLLEAGADVDSVEKDNRTALFWSSLWGNRDAVKALLDYRAGIEIADTDGETPLIAAASKGHASVIQLLHSHGADVNKSTVAGNTALSYACRNSHGDAAATLINLGASVNDPRLLHSAVTTRKLSLVRKLLDAGADVNARDGSGSSPLLVLPSNSSASMVTALIKAGANVNAVNKSGETALSRAADWDAVRVFEVLIKHGADINAGDEKKLPAVVATSRGSSKCLAILREIPGALPSSERG